MSWPVLACECRHVPAFARLHQPPAACCDPHPGPPCRPPAGFPEGSEWISDAARAVGDLRQQRGDLHAGGWGCCRVELCGFRPGAAGELHPHPQHPPLINRKIRTLHGPACSAHQALRRLAHLQLPRAPLQMLPCLRPPADAPLPLLPLQMLTQPLSECAQGHVCCKAKLGDALLFFNVGPDGTHDKHAMHTGGPPVLPCLPGTGCPAASRWGRGATVGAAAGPWAACAGHAAPPSRP
jgi:hypothetical protein